MAKIKVRIDGIDIEVEEGTTVINAAYQAGVKKHVLLPPDLHTPESAGR